MTHSLRTLQQKYVPVATSGGVVVKALQKGITSGKGIALDHDTLSRDMFTLAQDTDAWVKDLPVVSVGGGGGGSGGGGGFGGGGFGGDVSMDEPGKGRLDGVSIFAAPCTATLLNLTNQLGSLHKILSTRLLEARAPVKSLRDLETEIENRESKLKHAQTQNIRKPDQSLVIQIEQIQNEIKHLETGRDQKMIEAVKDSQQKTWEAYEEFAKNLASLSHAAGLLIPLLPGGNATTSNQGPFSTASRTLTPGEQREKTRAVEEGIRKTLAGLEGGWSITVEDGGLAARNYASGNTTPSILRRQSSIPPYLIGEVTSPKLQADIIGTYPSSHIGLNDAPPPIPQRRMSGTYGPSASFGSMPPVHRHPSSFNHPISAAPSLTAGEISPGHTTPLSGSAIVDDPMNNESGESATATATAPHPTVAETGIPISSSTGPGPSHGQLERREPPKSADGIIKLDSFGNADDGAAAVPPAYEASGGQSGRMQAEEQLTTMGVQHATPGGQGPGSYQG